jgi:hypothetical protein
MLSQISERTVLQEASLELVGTHSLSVSRDGCHWDRVSESRAFVGLYQHPDLSGMEMPTYWL